MSYHAKTHEAPLDSSCFMVMNVSILGTVAKERSKVLGKTDGWLVPSPETTRKRLWQRYDKDGVFFSRQTLEDLQHQLESIREQHSKLPAGAAAPQGGWPNITIADLNGEVREHRVALGDKSTWIEVPAHFAGEKGDYEHY